MNIAVLSGKGGTGKTTVSTNLARVLNFGYVDSDVEEPNGFIFLNPSINKEEEVFIEYPIIDEEKCTLCNICTKSCQFNALAKAGNEIVVFEKLCHDCGACSIACKYDAISYNKRSIGKIQKGLSNDTECIRGILNVGEPMAVPVIEKLLKELPKHNYIVDCPPGTSCNVVNALRYVDGAILVTEPSEFGLHDLKMAIDLVKLYNIPYGIVINKDDGKDNIVKKFCKDSEVKLLGTVKYKMEAAALYSKGIMLYEDESYKNTFREISKNIKETFTW